MQERTLFFFFSISDAETNFYEFWSPFPFPLPPKKHTCTQWGLSCTCLPLPQTDWPVNTFLNPLSICTGHSQGTCSFARTRACLYRMGPKPHCSPPSLLLGASHTLRTLSALFHSYHRTWFWPFYLWPLGLGYLPPFWGLAPWHFSASLADSISIWERERYLQDQTNTDM